MLDVLSQCDRSTRRKRRVKALQPTVLQRTDPHSPIYRKQSTTNYEFPATYVCTLDFLGTVAALTVGRLRQIAGPHHGMGAPGNQIVGHDINSNCSVNGHYSRD
jgi:hypothetical protein